MEEVFPAVRAPPLVEEPVTVEKLLSFISGNERKNVRELQALLAKKEDENAALRRQVEWLTQQLEAGAETDEG